MKKRKILMQALIYLLLLPGLLMILFPMYITIVNASKTPQESGSDFFRLPSTIYLGNYQAVLQKNDFFLYIFNTLVIALGTLPIELLLTPLTGYCIQRNARRRYFRFLYAFIVCGIFIPFQARMIPLVQMMSRLLLMNKIGMVLLYLAATTPPAVFLVNGACKAISTEIEEAAIIDGCGPLRVYLAVILPLLKPILSTLLIKDALFIWNDFQLPLIILNRSSKLWTLQLFQYNFKSQYEYDYNLAFASFLMTMLPIMILYVFMQKNFVTGLASGAIKG